MGEADRQGARPRRRSEIVAALFALDEARPGARTMVWVVTGVWITLRMALGVARIWPGLGDAPLRAGSEPAEP